MKSLAVIVSGGSTNNLIQVLTLLMAAVHSEMMVKATRSLASIVPVTSTCTPKSRSICPVTMAWKERKPSNQETAITRE